MKIWNRFHIGRIFLDVPLLDKDDVLRFISEAFASEGLVSDSTMLYHGLCEREKTLTTGIGGGIGIPHAISGETEDVALLLIRLANPVDFESLDAQPVQIILGLVAPETKPDLHLRVLAALARLCQAPGFMNAVKDATDKETLLKEIKGIEEKMAFH